MQSCFGLFVRICGILLLCHTKLDFISSAFGIVHSTCEYNLLCDLQTLLLLSSEADSDHCNRSICYGQIFPEIYFYRVYLF